MATLNTPSLGFVPSNVLLRPAPENDGVALTGKEYSCNGGYRVRALAGVRSRRVGPGKDERPSLQDFEWGLCWVERKKAVTSVLERRMRV